MREQAWQFQGYWAAWRLKAENDVVFHSSTAFLRSEWYGKKYVRSLEAYSHTYFRETDIKKSWADKKFDS